jgi:hypothetical protein
VVAYVMLLFTDETEQGHHQIGPIVHLQVLFDSTLEPVA